MHGKFTKPKTNLFDCIRFCHQWRLVLSILFKVNMRESGHSLKKDMLKTFMDVVLRALTEKIHRIL